MQQVGKGVYILTMGCAKNEADSLDMARRLESAGYTMVDRADDADCIIVNTCSFIQSATEESLEAVFDMSGLENVSSGKTKLVVAGCMPARYADDLNESLTEADAFVGCADEGDIVSIVDDALGVSSLEHAPVGASRAAHAGLSAYIKISDGCDRFCSYCTIPFIRGRYHSFTFDRIKADVAQAVSEGTREIVLIAQDTGRWGTDFEEKLTLAWLMDRLAVAFPDTWFRVMYLQPEGVTDELLAVMARHDNICSYLDIPFQHANARVLEAMNRTGSAAQFNDLIAHIRNEVPGVTLRTTVIAGFPSETQEEFEQLCDFIEEADLDYVGVFPYSQEEGTRAARLDGQIEEEEKTARAQQIRDIADALSTARVNERIGSEMDVLVMGREEDGQLYGRAQCQAPDVDGVVYLESGKPGEIVKVTIHDTLMYEMEGC